MERSIPYYKLHLSIKTDETWNELIAAGLVKEKPRCDNGRYVSASEYE